MERNDSSVAEIAITNCLMLTKTSSPWTDA